MKKKSIVLIVYHLIPFYIWSLSIIKLTSFSLSTKEDWIPPNSLLKVVDHANEYLLQREIGWNIKLFYKLYRF